MNLKFTLLGTGASTGVPVIQCQCSVCTSSEPRNHRLRCSVWLELNGKHILIDTSPDFRQQAIRAKIPRVDAVIYTHPHADHLHGVDDLRSYNYLQKQPIPVFAHEWTTRELKARYEYIFAPPPKVYTLGPPRLTLHSFEANALSINVLGEEIIPIPQPHGKETSVGYRIGDFAYVTDCSEVDPSRLKHLDLLILDCLRIEPHPTHLHLEKALEIIQELKPKTTYLTHLGHEIHFETVSQELPPQVYLAYDGLTLSLS